MIVYFILQTLAYSAISSNGGAVSVLINGAVVHTFDSPNSIDMFAMVYNTLTPYLTEGAHTITLSQSGVASTYEVVIKASDASSSYKTETESSYETETESSYETETESSYETETESSEWETSGSWPQTTSPDEGYSTSPSDISAIPSGTPVGDGDATPESPTSLPPPVDNNKKANMSLIAGVLVGVIIAVLIIVLCVVVAVNSDLREALKERFGIKTDSSTDDMDSSIDNINEPSQKKNGVIRRYEMTENTPTDTATSTTTTVNISNAPTQGNDSDGTPGKKSNNKSIIVKVTATNEKGNK